MTRLFSSKLSPNLAINAELVMKLVRLAFTSNLWRLRTTDHARTPWPISATGVKQVDVDNVLSSTERAGSNRSAFPSKYTPIKARPGNVPTSPSSTRQPSPYRTSRLKSMSGSQSSSQPGNVATRPPSSTRQSVVSLNRRKSQLQPACDVVRGEYCKGGVAAGRTIAALSSTREDSVPLSATPTSA